MTRRRDVRLSVRAKPGCRRPSLSYDGERLIVAVRERAVAGAANAAVVAAVATWLDLAPSRISIERGAAARDKVLEIDAPAEAVAVALAGLR